MCLAIPGQIVAILDPANHIAKVDVSGVRRSVNISLVVEEGVGPGDWVLIHVGFALSRLDEDAAKQTLRFLETLGEEYDQTVADFDRSDIE